MHVTSFEPANVWKKGNSRGSAFIADDGRLLIKTSFLQDHCHGRIVFAKGTIFPAG